MCTKPVVYVANGMSTQLEGNKHFTTDLELPWKTCLLKQEKHWRTWLTWPLIWTSKIVLIPGWKDKILSYLAITFVGI